VRRFFPRLTAKRKPDYINSFHFKHFAFSAMKVASSIKSLKNRHRDCQVVRRKGRVYVINKTNPRFKARQG